MTNFNGNWKLHKSENFEDFLKSIDVGLLKRQAAKMVSSEHHIVQDGDKMSVTVVATGQKGKQQEYSVGGSFSEQEVTGDTAEVSTEWDGARIKEIHNAGDFTYTLLRELQDENTMVLHLESPKGTQAKRIYKKM
ncbi:fatty acid-binding protein-like isoform X2 [Bolinopsis microptera]|uniref:fatty acid-binding protein-like isoform X2 n=1 Tax=Bolinopsis microptera TaxID=2820187 RepID=UPI003079E21B